MEIPSCKKSKSGIVNMKQQQLKPFGGGGDAMNIVFVYKGHLKHPARRANYRLHSWTSVANLVSFTKNAFCF